MKNRVIFGTLGGIFFALNTHAQFPCENSISTNPSAPYNAQQFAFSTPNFLNSFDWHDNDGNTLIYDWPVYNMGSYWNQGSGYLHAPFTSSGLGSDYSYFYSKPINDLDFYPEDGWELVSVNLGAYPDGTVIPGAGSSYKNIPYLLMYNKYRSVLRLFANTQVDPLTNPFTGVEVTLTYSNGSKVAGTLNGNGATFSSLDQTTSITSITSFANHPNNYSKWFYVDYEVAYDPCVCHFRSDLKFDFSFIKPSSSIELVGRSVTIEQDLVNPDGSANYSKDFLSSIDYSGSGGMNAAGTLIFKEIDEMYQYYIDELERIKQEVQGNIEYNKKIDRWLAIVKVAKVVAQTGIAIYTGNPLIIATNIANIAPDLFRGDGSVDKKKFGDALNGVLSWGSSKISGKLDALKKPEEIPGPDMPTASFTEMSFSGAILDEPIVYAGPIFFNPGTYGNVETVGEAITPHNYPVYNEALGIFALLQTPKLTYQTSVTLNPILNTWLYEEAEVKLKPSSELKFVFNPALDINWEHSKVEVAIEFVPYVGYELYPNGYTEVLDLINTQPKFINSNETGKEAKASPWFTTDFVPIGCYSDLLMEIHRENPDWILFTDGNDVFEILKANVKFKISLEYNSTNHYGDKNSGFYVYSYPMEVISGSVSGIPAFNINDFEKDISLEDMHFTQNTVLQAWNNIYINGELTCDPGVTVSILAGNEIIVEGESEISEEITLEIDPVLSCDFSVTQTTEIYVRDFCDGQIPTNQYQAKTPTKLSIPNNVGIDSEIDQTESEPYLNAQLYPNPANNLVNINVVCTTGEEVIIELLDMTGKVLERSELSNSNVREGYNVATLSTAAYASGYYFIQVQSGDFTKTEKLILQK